MNCLNRIEIQKYLDKEVDQGMADEISHHLDSCSECSMLYRQAANDREMIHKLLSNDDLQDWDVEIPVFKRPKIPGKKKTVYRLIPYILAASLILFVILIRFDRSYEVKSIPEAEILLYKYYEGKDLNKMWHEKSHILLLQDESGEVIEPILLY